LTEAAHGGLKPSPTGRLRRVLLHLSYSMALSHLLDTAPPSLLTTAARGGLRPAPDCRPRRALLHLSYSSAPSYADGAFVTHGRVEMWRSGCRPSISVAAPFVWRCLTGSAVALFPHPPGHRRRSPAPGSHRTWRADFPHQRSSAVASQHFAAICSSFVSMVS
jgi:hypothetical protein